MSCFFCESSYHLSQNCEDYIYDESRKEMARSKDCCEFCLTKLDHIQLKSHFVKKQCAKCVKRNELNKENGKLGKCLTCFTNEHDAVFCRNRFTAPNYFIPNIDQIMLQRFLHMIDPFEQYPLILSSPKTLNIFPLKEISIILNSQLRYRNSIYPGKNVIFSGSLYVSYCVSKEMINLFNSVNQKTVAFKAKKVAVYCSDVSFQEFLQLLSQQTKILQCEETTFTSNPAEITLKEIFEHVPNIEEFEFLRTNANIDFSWLKDLNERKNKESLKVFKISISSLKFSAMDLAIFMKELSGEIIQISLYLHGFNQISAEKLKMDVVNFLNLHFVERERLADDRSCLYVAQHLFYKVPIGCFTVV